MRQTSPHLGFKNSRPCISCACPPPAQQALLPNMCASRWLIVMCALCLAARCPYLAERRCAQTWLGRHDPDSTWRHDHRVHAAKWHAQRKYQPNATVRRTLLHCLVCTRTLARAGALDAVQLFAGVPRSRPNVAALTCLNWCSSLHHPAPHATPCECLTRAWLLFLPGSLVYDTVPSRPREGYR